MKDFIFQEILFEFDKISSTQTEAKRIIANNEGGRCFIVSAKTQTSGRGRLERKWESSSIGNIYMTLAITDNLLQEKQEILPLYTALSIMKSIGEKTRYKWANDIIIEDRKVAGILIEKISNFFLIGIGINNKQAPKNTIFPAGSLKEFGLSLSTSDVFENFKTNLHLRKEYVLNFLAERFFSSEKITINQGEFSGFFKGLTNAGNLILKEENGKLREIKFGDVGIKI